MYRDRSLHVLKNAFQTNCNHMLREPVDFLAWVAIMKRKDRAIWAAFCTIVAQIASKCLYEDL